MVVFAQVFAAFFPPLPVFSDACCSADKAFGGVQREDVRGGFRCNATQCWRFVGVLFFRASEQDDTTNNKLVPLFMLRRREWWAIVPLRP